MGCYIVLDYLVIMGSLWFSDSILILTFFLYLRNRGGLYQIKDFTSVRLIFK